MKHKRLIKILCTLEDIMAFIFIVSGLILLIGDCVDLKTEIISKLVGLTMLGIAFISQKG